MRKNDGFMAMDVLFALFILSLMSLLLVYIFKNNNMYIDKNREISHLRLETQNIVDSINLDSKDINRSELGYKDTIDIEIDKGVVSIIKEEINEELWKLYIETRSNRDKNILLKWVVVVGSS